MLKARFPVHVTVRVAEGVWNLRSRRSWRVLEKAFIVGGNRFGFRVVDYSVQHNHVHMICEAEGESSLSRGVKGLCVRMARGLNKMMGRKGRVFADRYHVHILRTPSEVRNALHYVLGNHRIHLTRRGEKIPDSYREWVDISYTSRDRRFHPPTTWLLRTAHSTA